MDFAAFTIAVAWAQLPLKAAIFAAPQACPLT
jgi:hypothetical protein